MTDSKRTRIKPVKDGHLPITELTSPMAAASSPFGDDVAIPMSPESLNWEHSNPEPPRLPQD
ncbi:hypothetical protein LX16_2793 [Stackebrandtia albiflava]|uniref:Uncharacterized protein n=1 Tax=Stackebrandtia albiflava TaxID=406432 RepID=A0A562V2L2_9ACTN|nr:hypothetical protein [Stackebrandtia albiflava]TWJ12047.1 hypothetical protein LX16_2793 [Stackebrandtia albiflava]